MPSTLAQHIGPAAGDPAEVRRAPRWTALDIKLCQRPTMQDQPPC